MPLPYTGPRGELNFEEDFIDSLKTSGWEHNILKNYSVEELINNWRNIIFDRNRSRLGGIPLSDDEMLQVLDAVKQQANTPCKANHFINSANRGVAIKRDKTSQDKIHAGKEVYLDLFQAQEIAGGTSRYQIAEQTNFINGNPNYPDRRGDITLLIDGIPVIHIELKASGVDVFEACTQIQKYTQEGVFTGFMSLVQIFWAITPEDALYFSNPGDKDKFNPAFFFRWGDRNNNIIKDWKELIKGQNHILSIPEAHKMIGYYTIADVNADILKVVRSYQFTAIKAIVDRTRNHIWGNTDKNNQQGGYIWCTTGGGKTMTSFKSGQLIIDMNLADKVVFVVDRKALDEQSYKEYSSFQRDGETIVQTTSSFNLFNKLKSSSSDDSLILTSIQKLANVNEDSDNIDKKTLEMVAQKRIVFIIDEAHRSQFGLMHESVKKTFYNALFFGFTGTPIMSNNMRDGEQTTESVFGLPLAIYSLATGIRDKNVLGFWPQYVKTFDDDEIRKAVASHELRIKKEDLKQLQPGTNEYRVYKHYLDEVPMASSYDDTGKLVEKGIEDYLISKDFNDAHREAVVKNILEHFKTISNGTKGTLFHSILATSSIQEACKYWELFRLEAPDLHVTALFDPNINGNTAEVIEKSESIVKIIEHYNSTFETSFNRKNDPNLEGFKADLTARLAHKKPYQHIGNNHKKCLDIVIVVDQLLTGFDSVYVNVLYMDKEMEYDNLIQAISRTNRIFDNDEKPWGMVKFFRKTETMRRNLDKALELYCQGDSTGVQEKELKDNIKKLNELYKDICDVFSHEDIQNFVTLPSSDADRQKFRKDFCEVKSTLRAAFLQGFKWSNEYSSELDFDESTYKILKMRFSELHKGGGGHKPGRFGFDMETNVSEIKGEQIDAAYLESRFTILTISDIERDNVLDIVQDIKNHLGVLPAIMQKYALQVLNDIENKVFTYIPGKKFMEYISEYREMAIRKAVTEEAMKFGLDVNLLLDIYHKTDSNGINQLELKKLENTANIELVIEKFNASTFVARRKLHAEICEFIEMQKAEKSDVDNN